MPNGTPLDSVGSQRLGMEAHPRTVTWSTIEARCVVFQISWRATVPTGLRRNLGVMKSTSLGAPLAWLLHLPGVGRVCYRQGI